MGVVKKAVSLIIALLVVAAAGIGGAYYAGILEKPTAGLEDYGDWGEVTEDRTEVITSVWVNNPNPAGLTIADSISASYQLYLNDVNVANGQKVGISIQPGNNTIQISTYIQNENLSAWWVAFVQNDETIALRTESTANIDAGPLSTSIDLPTQRQTLLQDSTPVINALSQTVAAAEGEYTKTISVGTGLAEESETVGYEIKRGWATWGNVNQDTTTVLFHLRIHNPSDTVAVPAVPDGVGVSVDMNDVRLFRAQGEELSPQNVDGDAVIQPGETREVVFAVQMDNSKIDEWFRSHVRNNEQTEITTQFQLVFNTEETTFRVPEKGGLTYTCNLQTAILEDGQQTETDCLQPESVPS